jgi:hypothetical protein
MSETNDPWQSAPERPGGIPLLAWRGSAYTGSQEMLTQVSGVLPALQARAAWLAGRHSLRLEESCVVPVPSESTPLQMMAEDVGDHEMAEAVAGVRLAAATLAAGGVFSASVAQGPGGLIAGWRLPDALVPFLLWVRTAPTNCPAAVMLTLGGVWPLAGVSQNGAALTMGVHTSTAAAVSGADQLLADLWKPEPAGAHAASWQLEGDDDALLAGWQKALGDGKAVDQLPGRDPAKGIWPLILHAAPNSRRLVGFSPREEGFAATLAG